MFQKWVIRLQLCSTQSKTDRHRPFCFKRFNQWSMDQLGGIRRSFVRRQSKLRVNISLKWVPPDSGNDHLLELWGAIFSPRTHFPQVRRGIPADQPKSLYTYSKLKNIVRFSIIIDVELRSNTNLINESVNLSNAKHQSGRHLMRWHEMSVSDV